MNSIYRQADVSFSNPLENSLYAHFVGNHSDSTVFHSPAWIRVLHESYGFNPSCITVRAPDDVVGMLPYMETNGLFGQKRCVSLPFSDFCGPLVDDDNALRTLIDKLVEKGRHQAWKYIEIRGGTHFLPAETPWEKVFSHKLDLSPSADQLENKLKSSVRRNIRKAENGGLSVDFDCSLNGMKLFYELNCLTRKDHGLPPQPWKFMKNLHRLLIDGESGFAAIVKYGKKVIAAAVFLVYNNVTYYKYGASDRNYLHLRPNDYMLWRSILYCKKMKCRRLDLGRTEAHHAGLLRFKRGWDVSESLEHYYRLSVADNVYMKSENGGSDKSYTRVLSRLPLFLLKPIGTLFYRYVG